MTSPTTSSVTARCCPVVRLRVLGTDRLSAALNAGAARTKADLMDAVRTATRRVDRNAKINVRDNFKKNSHGTLRSSIRMQFDPARLTGRVGTDIVYAAIHEFGGVTRPHVIRVRNAIRADGKPGVLRFKVGGRWVYRKQVNHPGSRIPARPWLQPAYESAQDDIRRDFETAMRRTVDAQ